MKTAGSPLKRARTEPSVSRSKDAGAAGTRRPAPHSRTAGARRIARGRTARAPSRSSHAAISSPVHGRSSTAAPGTAAAHRQVRANASSASSAARAIQGAAGGSQESAAHRRKPPARSGAESGIRITFASGPIRETRPNTESHSGSSAAATAALHRRTAAAPRARRGHDSGAAASARAPAHRIAAQAPTLISALGESAAAGSRTRRTAAAKVRQAEPVASRPRKREARAAPSIASARTHGGSAPAASV